MNPKHNDLHVTIRNPNQNTSKPPSRRQPIDTLWKFKPVLYKIKHYHKRGYYIFIASYSACMSIEESKELGESDPLFISLLLVPQRCILLAEFGSSADYGVRDLKERLRKPSSWPGFRIAQTEPPEQLLGKTCLKRQWDRNLWHALLVEVAALLGILGAPLCSTPARSALG